MGAEKNNLWVPGRLRRVLTPVSGGATFVPFSTVERGQLLSSFASRATFISAHSAYPGDTGASEISGGVIPNVYTRVGITWGAPVNAQISLNTSPTLHVPAGYNAPGITFLGFWNLVAAGVFGGSVPVNNGEEAVPFTAQDTGDVFTSPVHALTNGMNVVTYDTELGTLPSPFVEGSLYFVVGATTNTFQLSATSGGSAIAATSDGVGFVQRVIPQPYPTAGDLTVGSLTIALLR